jgi:hypothetical protein
VNNYIQDIKEMRSRGMSLRDIARSLGKSPGSISGIMSRNRDIFPITDRQMSMLKQIGREKKSSNAIRKMFHEALNPPASPPKPKEEALAYDQSRLPYAVTFMDLDERRCCKWPLTGFEKGRPNLFCGEVKSGRNYCANHQERQWRVQ